jgi:hypothetical protein
MRWDFFKYYFIQDEFVYIAPGFSPGIRMFTQMALASLKNHKIVIQL